MQNATAKGTSEYAVVIEPIETGYSAYVPDLPGCVSVGETRKEALEMIAEVIEMHIESLRAHGETVPAPNAEIDRVSVHAA